MGNNFATEMVDGTLSDLGINLTLRDQISIQLRSNHYPPVPTSMVDPCIAAIEACNDNDWERMINLPSPITWRGQSSAPAHAIVDGHHLEQWCKGEEWDM